MRIISQFFAYLLHPLFMPLWSIFLLFNLPIYHNFKFPPAYFIGVYICVFFNLVLIPLSMAFYLKRQGIIQSLRMETVEERVYPYALSSIFYLITLVLLSQIQFPIEYLLIFGAASATVLILFLMALGKYKVSAHMAGIGGICGILYSVNHFFALNTIPLFALALLLAGVLAATRLHLKAHQMNEVILGFSIGLLTQVVLTL